jgi:hypothetical protein
MTACDGRAVLTARTAEGAPEGEPLLERLSGAEAVLDRLAELCSLDPDQLGSPEAWAARVDLDGTELVLRGSGDTWGISAPVGTDAGEAMSAARRLHGLLGALSGGWDDDR